MPALAFETKCRSDQQIAADFLSYLQSDSSDLVAYEVEPTRLTGGFDARIYRYKLIDHEPRVLRILRPEHDVEELLYLQVVHQILNQHGLKTPVIHRVCGDQSVLGGVFAEMDLVPGQPLIEQKSEVCTSILGESMAAMHELDVRPIVEAIRRSGVPYERFLSPAIHQKGLDLAEQKIPWASDLIGWLRDHFPLDGQDLAVIHGDYHGRNVMFENGSISGVLDWGFCISDPAIDLARTMNIHLVLSRQIDPAMSHQFLVQTMDEVLKAYQAIRPLNHERIKACRVADIFRFLVGSAAGVGPEFIRKPESQRDYLTFIEQTTGIRLSPSA